MDYKEYRENNYVKIDGYKIVQIEKVYQTEQTVHIKGEVPKFNISVLSPVDSKQIISQLKDRALIMVKEFLVDFPGAPVHEIQNGYFDLTDEELPITL